MDGDPRSDGVLVARAWLGEGGAISARMTMGVDRAESSLEFRVAASDAEILDIVAEWLRRLREA